VIHRDIKPSNVVISTKTGSPVLVDFGLVKRDKAKLARPTMDETLFSLQGQVLGTPSYMAPEQADAETFGETGPWSDVWGLGATLYFLLTGEAPFPGTGIESLTKLISKPPPDPRDFNPEIPDAVADVILRCLSKQASARPASASALADALSGLEPQPASEPPAARPTARATASVLLLTVLGLGGGLAAWIKVGADRRPAAAPTSPASASAADSGDVPAASAPPPAAPVHGAVPQVAGSPRDATAAEDAPAGPPGWYAQRPDSTRAPLPLPEGIRFGDADGEYVNEKDDSILVWVGPGRYSRGSEEWESTQPVHPVNLRHGFFIGKYEVTWAQYERFCQDTRRLSLGRQVARWSYRPTGETLPIEDRHPVWGVRWIDAEAYVRWAGLRLPNEAEWEFAARGPQSLPHPWGYQLPHHALRAGQPRANLGRLGATPNSEADDQDGYLFHAPVGSFPAGASPFGCLDMVGNVWEWCQDTFDPSQRTYARAPRGGSAWEVAGTFDRAYRGGCWSSPSGGAAQRGGGSALTRNGELGFRVAR
jgi:formylglycine-generating enzyme required for sulfatase activity